MAHRRRKITLRRPSFDGCPESDFTIEFGYQTVTDMQWLKFTDHDIEDHPSKEIYLAPQDLDALAYLLCSSYIGRQSIDKALKHLDTLQCPYDVYETTKDDEDSWELDVEKTTKDL